MQMENEYEYLKLNRFTSVPFVFDLVNRKVLTLVNPELWEDYNDRATMQVYKEKVGAKSIYALCLTHRHETIHHWNAFANGPSGCKIEFRYNQLIAELEQNKGVLHGETKYMKVNELTQNTNFPIAQLPFVKRLPFKPENEYRILVVSDLDQTSVLDIPIQLDCIRSITFSNKLPKPTYESLKRTLLLVEPGLKGKILRSTLYKNSQWIDYFNSI